MSMSTRAGQMDNLLRLQGLKNVSGRKKRVIPGAEFLQELEDADFDMAGTAPEYPPMSEPYDSTNQPEPDLGVTLSPQSYDVRSNSVTAPDNLPVGNNTGEASVNQSIWPRFAESMQNYSRFGGNGANQGVAQTPPVETQQVDLAENLPPVSASQQEQAAEQEPSVWQTLGMGAPSLKEQFTPPLQEKFKENFTPKLGEQIIEPQRGGGFKLVPNQPPEAEQLKNYEDQDLNADIDKAMENPWQYAAYGATGEVQANPQLQQEFQNTTGMALTPEIADQVSEYEEAMKAVEDSLMGINEQLDERAEAIKNRITANQATDADKFYIGLALLMPLLVGGLLGKEAGLGALGGTAKGLGDVYANREKGTRADEQTLLDIAGQRTSTLEKLANLKLNKQKLAPSKEQTAGKMVSPGLYAKPEYLQTKEDQKRMRKQADELLPIKNYTEELTDITDDLVDAISQLKDKGTFNKAYVFYGSKLQPGSLAKLTDDVIINGKKHNAGVFIDQQIGLLSNAYTIAKQMGQLDRAAQAHMNKLVNNPTSSQLSGKDALNQILAIRNLVQKGYVRDVENRGFDGELAKQEFLKRNEGVREKLNQRAGVTRTEEEKKRMAKTGVKNAK